MDFSEKKFQKNNRTIWLPLIALALYSELDFVFEVTSILLRNNNLDSIAEAPALEINVTFLLDQSPETWSQSEQLLLSMVSKISLTTFSKIHKNLSTILYTNGLISIREMNIQMEKPWYFDRGMTWNTKYRKETDKMATTRIQEHSR